MQYPAQMTIADSSGADGSRKNGTNLASQVNLLF